MVGADGAALLERLRDRGQPRVRGGLDVVEADDRQLARHRHAGRRAASSTPIAWMSELAKTAVGRSLAARAARRRRRGRPRARAAAHDPLGRAAAPRRRSAPPRSPRAGARWSRTRTGSPPRRRRSRSAGGRAPSRCSAGHPAALRRRRRDRRQGVVLAVDQHDRDAGRLEPPRLARRSGRARSRARRRSRPRIVSERKMSRAARAARRRTGSAGSPPRRACATCRAGARSPTAG